MLKKTLIILSSVILGIGLSYTSLKNYKIFNMIIEFIGSGGFF